MRTLYFDCSMGAAGDMLMAALWELLAPGEQQAFLERVNNLGLPGVTLEIVPSSKCGVRGTSVMVLVAGVEEGEEPDHHHQDHHHSSLAYIEEIISGLPLSSWVRREALSVFRLLAEAESQVHGQPITDIHFHEVGSLDAVADIVGVCLLMEMIAPEKVFASPIQVGNGQVHCAHGLLPVPAPATAWLLREVPIYGGEIQGELCTPTGAALLKHFVTDFGPLAGLRISHIGYGMGKKDFPAANCLRALLGEGGAGGESGELFDQVVELRCNLDDMSPEAVAFACQELLEAGALDVFTIAAQMKKGRLGLILTCLCPPEEKDRFIALIFRHTTTLGVREYLCRRDILRRGQEERQTEAGPIRVKQAQGWGVTREKPEYEDLAALARKEGLSLAEIYDKYITR